MKSFKFISTILLIIFSLLLLCSQLISYHLFILEPKYIKVIINFLSIIGISIGFYSLLKNNIEWINNFFKTRLNNLMSKGTEDKKNEIWRDIVGAIETTHHSSIISKIKELDSEDTVKFPQYNSKKINNTTYQHEYDFNIRFLHKIKEFMILFDIILEKLAHKDINMNLGRVKTDKYRNYIKEQLTSFTTTQYKFRLYLNLYNLFYLLIPISLTLLLSSLIDISTDNNSYFNFFFGISIFVLIFPLIRLVDNLIGLLSTKFKFYIDNSIVPKSFYLVILSFFFTIIILIGISFLADAYDAKNNFSAVFKLFISIMFEFNIHNNFDFMFMSKTDDYIHYYLPIIKFIIWFTVIGIIYNSINSFFKDYDQFYYEQKIKKYLLPPDLLKIISLFLLTVISIGYLYMMAVSSISNYDTNNTKVECNNTVQEYSLLVEQIKGIEKDINEDMSLKNILPFSIFLALLGTLLAIATKDIMENYFTGLSMKINSPYEEGDRIKISDYGLLEVREIGTRSDEFYEITTNSIISIPHKRLAQIDIKNYTYPTLDYRDEIVIYVEDNTEIKESNIPREAEKILLMSAFINTGVKLPKIKVNNNDYDKFKNDFGLNEYLNFCEKYLDTNSCNKVEIDKQEFNNIINEIWENLLTQNKDFFKKLFIRDLPNNLSQFISNKDEDIKLELLIKKSIIAIICSVIEYQEISEKLYIHYDKNGIRRKYKIFNKKSRYDLDDLSKNLVNISFYYYMLANRLWELKDSQNSLIQKRKIDKAMTQILDVPRVSSSHEFNDGIAYWKVKLLVTLELSEQSDETIHHINMYVNMLWDEFLVDKHKKLRYIKKKN